MEKSIIPRGLGQEILSLAKTFPVISLTGPRQSGITTLVRSLFPEYANANLENLDNRLAAQEDPFRFLTPHSRSGIIVDEAQKAPALFSYLQGIVDESGETLNEDFFKGLPYIKRLSAAPDTHFYLVYGGKRDSSRKHAQVLGWKGMTHLPHI